MKFSVFRTEPRRAGEVSEGGGSASCWARPSQASPSARPPGFLFSWDSLPAAPRVTAEDVGVTAWPARAQPDAPGARAASPERVSAGRGGDRGASCLPADEPLRHQQIYDWPHPHWPRVSGGRPLLGGGAAGVPGGGGGSPASSRCTPTPPPPPGERGPVWREGRGGPGAPGLRASVA